ncbi:Trm112 family protein [Henriciella marina]|uniref:Trm112 family protein n=1 Tax=Henriciella marina TaxID=453851 RepID=UPI00035D1D40|nr:Trm112 family protein [Henriciella marina]
MSDKSDHTETRATATDPRLLEQLICPVSRAPLVYDRERQELVSKRAQLAYPIRDGLPIMLESEARVLDESAGS